MLYWGTPSLQFVPWRALAVESYRSGIVPFWNPLLGAGAPLAANLQSAVFYPLNAIYFLLPPAAAASWSAALHVALAGWFTYGFVRILGVGRPGALLAALAYELSGPVVTRAHFSSMISASPWLPVLLSGVELSLRAAPSWRAQRVPGAITALGLSMPLLAGHAQLTAMFAVVATLYGSVRFVSMTLDRRRRLIIALSMAGGVVLAAGATLVQTIATGELLTLSTRAAGVDSSFGMFYSLPTIELLRFLIPDYFGNPATGVYRGYGAYYENAGYIGIIPLGLALGVACRCWKTRKERIVGIAFWSLAALTTVTFALGIFSPVYPWLFGHVPGFNLFQAPARWLYVTGFSLAILSAYGLDQWLAGLRPVQPGRRGFQPAPLAVALGIGMIAAVVPIFAGLVASPVHPDVILGVVRLGALLIAGGVAFVIVQRRPAAWGLIVLVASADLLIFAFPANPATDPRLLEPSGTRLEQPGLRRYTSEVAFMDDFWAAINPRSYRGRPGGWEAVRRRSTPNVGMLDGVAETYNYDPLELRSVRVLRTAVESIGAPDRLLRVFAAGQVRRTSGDAAEPVDEPLPRAFLVERVVSAADDPLRAMLDPSFDPRMGVAVAVSDASRLGALSAPPDSAPAGMGGVELIEYSPLHVEARATAVRSAILVLSDAWYPGWRAFLDDQEAPIIRANYAFRAVAMPAGQHVVRFEYRPDWWPWAGCAVGAAWLIVTLLVAAEWCRPSERTP